MFLEFVPLAFTQRINEFEKRHAFVTAFLKFWKAQLN